MSTLAALATAAVAVIIAFLTTDAPPAEWTIPLSVTIFLVYWLSFAVYYLWWTRRTWVGRLSGLTGPTDWTTAAAMMAVVVTVAIALSPGARENPVIILLGLSTVASSWALMVYSFALDYMQVTVLQSPQETPHITFGFAEEPRFSDYLTFSVMVSTMAFAAPAEVTSRQMWRKLRNHVLLAFIFNTVIVAMMVSLLFGGLTGN
ncbi:DUF1345 domain-containing protein [Corynebacterium glyciniphilum]|uniref:DUF1345 domain-containing protein n=1 Tax=Corynebacterium glyciniphilum TaxID=1404244 RepID=UPI003FD63CD7